MLEFWNEGRCRGTLLTLARSDVSVLRLVCHGISERVTSQCFASIDITFRARSFSKPARLAALQRIGHNIKEATFRLPRNIDTTLPPLIDPWTGEQKPFVWRPSIAQGHVAAKSAKRPRYGDEQTTELLIRQYPPLFHAATNVRSFVTAMSYLINLEHLRISCAAADGAMPSKAQGTDVVAIALTSLRCAIEEARLKHLDTLTLSSIRSTDIVALAPPAISVHPGSTLSWCKVRVLDITMYSEPNSTADADQLKLLRKYVGGHKGLRRFSFRWLGTRGPSPLPELASEQKTSTHPALRHASASTPAPLFPHLEYLALDNVVILAIQVKRLMQTHKSTLVEIDLENIVLKDGSWYETVVTMDSVDVKAKATSITEEGDVPIMLAPSMTWLQTPPKMPKAGHNDQTNEATERARKMLLAKEIRKGDPLGHQSRRVDNKEQKKKRVKGVSASPCQRLKRKCGDLMSWRMRNGPTLIVG